MGVYSFIISKLLTQAFKFTIELWFQSTILDLWLQTLSWITIPRNPLNTSKNNNS